MDTGTFDSLISASNYVQSISRHQNILICSPEIIAYNNGWITKETLKKSAEKYGKSPYGAYLKGIAESD